MSRKIYRRMGSPDFGNIVGFGAVADPSAGGAGPVDTGTPTDYTQMPADTATPGVPTGAPVTTQAAAPAAAADPTGGMCSQGMCQAMGGATAAALSALGPKAATVPAATLQALASDKSPAGQAAYQAALAQNAAAATQNSQRQAIIAQFVKNAVGSKVTAAQMQIGDAALVQY